MAEKSLRPIMTNRDLLDGQRLLRLTDIERELPWVPRQHVSTWYRWATEGLRDGQVKLSAIRVGSKLCTTEAAVRAFLQQLNGAPPAPAQKSQQDAHRKAEAVLKSAGF